VPLQGGILLDLTLGAQLEDLGHSIVGDGRRKRVGGGEPGFARGASDQAAVRCAVIALVEPLPQADVDRMQRIEAGALDEVQALLA
jgi:hypothetical protein